MKQWLLIIILASISFITFSQEKKSRKPFANPPETKPRFFEDTKLTECQNKTLFNAKIKQHFIKNMENSAVKDSIKHKIFFSFKIDTTGASQFHKIRPQKLETIYLKEELIAIVNSLPKFKPATQRNKKVITFYTITLFKNE